ncbi:uncharacterized protein EI90DRAFT_3076139, partial [Cantharellus anzutake]|uniref:uncharacterized protein n=1 Tax=Cantharellus anzutake TaxID=1750568 RepID=UPI001903768D
MLQLISCPLPGGNCTCVQAGSILALSGVRSHMRIQRDIVGCLHIETVAPSEPALAITAMKELMTSREAYKRALDI